jgi:tetrahydromethanopterin S-methyltransferase subunit G
LRCSLQHADADTGANFFIGDGSYKKLTAGGTHDLILAEEGNGNGGGIQMSTLGGGPPPSWVADVDAIQQCLTEIQQRMDQLQSTHATRVGSVFGRDLDDMEGRIEKLTSSLTDQFRYAERLLQKVGVATRRAGGEEATVGANVQRRYVVYRLIVTFLHVRQMFKLETLFAQNSLVSPLSMMQSRQALARIVHDLSTVSTKVSGRSPGSKEWRLGTRLEIWY